MLQTLGKYSGHLRKYTMHCRSVSLRETLLIIKSELLTCLLYLAKPRLLNLYRLTVTLIKSSVDLVENIEWQHREASIDAPYRLTATFDKSLINIDLHFNESSCKLSS